VVGGSVPYCTLPPTTFVMITNQKCQLYHLISGHYYPV